MGLGAIVSSALEAARSATESLQVDVTHRARLDQDPLGAPVLADPVIRKALVQEGQRQLRTLDGRTLRVQAVLTFFPASEGEAPPAVNAADEIILPGGRIRQVIEVPETLDDPSSGGPYVRTVWLG